MLITGIYIRKDRLYLLYSGDDAVALLDEKAMAESGIIVGYNINEEALNKLIYQTDIRRATSKALDLLSRRDYCCVELMRRLSKNFSEDICQAVINAMLKKNYINDERYAKNAAYSLLSHKSFSPSRAVFELVSRGIDRDTAQTAVDITKDELEYDPIEEIYSVIERKYPKCAIDEKIQLRCFNALLRLGYSRSDIITAMDEYKADNLNEE